MKDMSYIGKQRLELLEKISNRFDGMIRTVKKSGDEKQFVVRPPAEWVIDLVQGCLRQFTPWETECVVEPGFDITYIPGLYFSGTDGSDEDAIEMNRIHTLVHPECFSRFADGLSKYIRSLPVDNQDKKCNFESLDQRLTVPQFSDFPIGPPRGNRFQSPNLTSADFVRLQRTIEARSRRRKAFVPRQLRVYVDNSLVKSFNARRANGIKFLIGPEAGVVEVRGRNADEELTMATLIVCCDEIPAGGAFRDSVANQAHQEIAIQITPIRDADGNAEGAQVEISYTEPRSIRSLISFSRGVSLGAIEGASGQFAERIKRSYLWLAAVVVLVALVALVSIVIWLRPEPPLRKAPEQAAQPPGEEHKPVSPATTPPRQQPPQTKEAAPLIARASWSTDKQAALSAIPIEPTRGEVKAVDLSRQTKMSLSLPVYDDDGRTYSRYRIIIASGEKSMWRETLRAPAVPLAGSAQILDIVLSPERLPKRDSFDLRVEGLGRSGWQPLGHVLLTLNR